MLNRFCSLKQNMYQLPILSSASPKSMEAKHTYVHVQSYRMGSWWGFSL